MPTKAQLVSPSRRAGRSVQQGGVAFALVLILNWILTVTADVELPPEVFGAAVTVLTALGSFVHARLKP